MRPRTTRLDQRIAAAATTETHDSRGGVARKLLLICALAFVVRMAVVLVVFRTLPESADHNEFGWEQGWIARSIAMGHGFSSPFQPLDGVPTALVAPLYPYLLAGIFRLFGLYSNASALVALGLNALISASVVVPVYGIARRALGSVQGGRRNTIAVSRDEAVWQQRLPWIAAMLWALYPYAIFYSSTYLWDHTLTGALFAWTFLMTLQLRRFGVGSWAAWGLLYGITALSNPSVLSLFPILVLVAVIGKGMPLRRGVLRVATAGLIVGAVLLPWSIRNIRVLHAVVPMRDGFWGEFYAGNNDDTSHTNPGWTHPGSNPTELKRYEQLGEVQYMAEKRDLSLQHVSAKPQMFALQCLRRAVRFWTGYWSFSAAYLQDEGLDVPNVPFCTALAFLTFAGAWRLLRLRRRAAFSFAGLLLFFPVPYYFTHASIDYRQPIEPELVVLIAVGGTELWRTLRARHALRTAQETPVLVAS